jgi:HEAT repeat protein
LALPADDVSALKTKVGDILSRFPATSAEGRDRLAAEVIQLGPAGIQLICGRLVAPGTGDDTLARFALNGVAVHISHGGSEKEREMYARTLIASLELAKNKEVKAFLIRQLQLAGKKEAVKPLKKYLKDKRLCEPATQALLAIRTKDAEKALLRSLGTVSAPNRITIIKALGELRSQKAAKKIIKYSTTRDKNLRDVALYALANIGHPNSEKVLDKIGVTAPSYERARAPSLYLLYAQRLAESGRKAQSVRVCRKMIKNYTAPQESHIQCAALSTLAAALGENAFGDLLAAMDNPNKELRWRALELAGAIKGEEATTKWIEKIAGATPEVQTEIITMLGRRGDKTALPAILQKLKSEEKSVRLAAIPAAAWIGGSDVLPELMDVLGAGGAEEISAVKQVLLGLQSSLVVSEAVERLEEMPPPGRVALIEILSERRAREFVDAVFAQTKNDERDVRRAALKAIRHLASEHDLPRLIGLLLETENDDEIPLIQNAAVASSNLIPNPDKRADLFLETLDKTPVSKQIHLLKPLSRIGGEQALQRVIQETKNEDENIQNVAIQTLSEWPDMSAAEELFNISRNTENQKHFHFSIQGIVRLVDETELTPEKKFNMLKEALEISENVDIKSLVISGLAKVKTLESLKLVAGYLDNPYLKDEAAIAGARIAFPLRGESVGLTGSEVIWILRKSSWLIEEENEKNRLERYIGTLLEREGYDRLFNGMDLSGWKGLVADPVSRAKMTPGELEKAQAEADEVMRAHWKAVDGILVFDGKGKSLCTVKDYGDFEMLVDWKIEEKGDSGIYLRGSPQVQIWDPAQWPEGSGGLYNNQKGPKDPLICVDNPIGEWNSFHIKMIGERVAVYLNDVLVVDNVIMENYWERDKPIYTSGQIELQSHSSPLYFRNIYIREIAQEINIPVLTEEESADGFVHLFNGRDLTGWVGDTVGYVAEYGKIVLYPEHGSGSLYTEKEFNDFILRFEFKLSSGTNNGLGIRAPLKGNAAYEGMELQILDNTADQYKDLKPYQYHGSIYGVVPAKLGYLKPVGEWNYQEVIAEGTRITVILNGETIVDADISEASASGTMDGIDHPGLKKETGHIGFLGHGSKVEFRNLRIKKLK